MSGASGPSTTPKTSVPREASTTPGSSAGGSGPVVLKPSAGEWPPVPGRNSIAAATTTPASAEDRQQPPVGHGIEPEAVRDVVEHRVLQHRDELEEAVRQRGDRHPDDRGEDDEARVFRVLSRT